MDAICTFTFVFAVAQDCKRWQKKSSMAHSTSNDATSKYIGAYPLPKMQEYNSYLLKVPQTVNSTEDLLKILKGMSEEERAALLAEVSK